jgi:cephalosporin hydroxylase
MSILWQMSSDDIEGLEATINGLPNRKAVIEIGSYVGGCTNYLAKKFDKVLAVDIDFSNFKPQHKNIYKHTGNSYELAPGLIRTHKPSLIIIDGDHEYDGVVKDLDAVLSTVDYNVQILVHDAAYEPSRKALMEAQEKYPNYRFFISYVYGVPFRDGNIGGFCLISN